MRDDDKQEHGGWPSALTDVRVVATLVALVILVVVAIAVWPGDPVQKNDSRVDRETRAGQVSQIGQAPDGTTVWAVRTHGRLVIFSKGSVVTLPG